MIDTDALARGRSQLWAEAYSRYKAGDSRWLDSNELNSSRRKSKRSATRLGRGTIKSSNGLKTLCRPKNATGGRLRDPTN